MIDTCKWMQGKEMDGEEDLFSTDCNEQFVLTWGTPLTQGIKFCCYCGKPLEEVLQDDDDD